MKSRTFLDDNLGVEEAPSRRKKGTAMSADSKTALHDRLSAKDGDLGETATRQLKDDGFEVFEASRGKRPENDFVFEGYSVY